MTEATQRRRWRLPFYYGWLIVGIAFVTMAIAVTTRTAFSLLLVPLIDEFGWDRGLAAGAFSFGFLISATVSPLVGRLVDRNGPRVVIGAGAVLLTAGLMLAPAMRAPWHLYATLGLLVGAGSNLMAFTVHSQFLPHWFVRNRGLAISIAFSGVGAGAIVLLPWLQTIIERDGWRAACWAMGMLVVFVVGPLNLLVRRRPEDIGLFPDGATGPSAPHRSGGAASVGTTRVAPEWTLARAMRSGRFWWIVLGYFCALLAWYAVQVHQTKFLIEVGFGPLVAAWALGIVSVIAIPGQIGLGALSDRIGREWIWTLACFGFAVCYAALIALEDGPSNALLYLMVGAQGLLGYVLAAMTGAIVADIFYGPHYGAVFGAINVALIGGGAAGPWVAGAIHDATGSYRLAFFLAIACCAISAVAIWAAGPSRARQGR